MKDTLTQKEIQIFRKLDTPAKIQDFLDTKIRANFEEHGDTCYSPRQVLKHKKAQCIEGAIFAAAALRFHGRQPLLVHLQATKNDLDHVIAVFQVRKLWGAISKTNHAVLRYREPIYKNLRELAMSYFHEYFDDRGRKNLRAYSGPLDLSVFDKKNWVTSLSDLWYIDRALNRLRSHQVLPRKKINLRKDDPIEISAGKLTVWK